MPTYQLLHGILTDLIPAAPDAEPRLDWGRGEAAASIYRFRGELYALPRMPESPAPELWHARDVLRLPDPLGTLEFEGPKEEAPELEVRYRQGGERIKLAGGPTRELKKLLQTWGVPPWLRDRLPLLYEEGRLVAVADICVAAEWAESTTKNSWRVTWLRADLDCGY